MFNRSNKKYCFWTFYQLFFVLFNFINRFFIEDFVGDILGFNDSVGLRYLSIHDQVKEGCIVRGIEVQKSVL